MESVDRVAQRVEGMYESSAFLSPKQTELRAGTYTVLSFYRLDERWLDKMRSALEAAGVEFISENGGGAGVRFKKPHVELAKDKGGDDV